MRTLSAICLSATALALAVINTQHPSAWNLVLSVAMLVMLGALVVLAAGHALLYALMAVAMLTAYVAGRAYSTHTLLLDGWPAAVLGVLAAFVVGWALLWARRKVRRVYPVELVVLTGRFGPGLQLVAGPAHVLPFLMKILAVMPRYQQEHTLTVERVNARPQPGPLGEVAQNINQIELELVYKLDDEACLAAFGMHNRDEFFKRAAEKVGQRYPAALREKLFWVEAWRLALQDIVERLLRAAVHRSGLSAMAVSERREQIEAMVIEQLRDEAGRMGLTILECNILNVEPDEAPAALAGRAALLQTLARVEEIKLTGAAQAGARAAQVRAMVEAVKAAGGQVPQRIVELIVHGVLPHSVLNAYVPSAYGASDTLFDLHARPGGKPGDPTRN